MSRNIINAVRRQSCSTRFWAYLIVTIIWMGIIFYMSAQPASTSSEQSGFVLQILEKIFHISILDQNIEVIDFMQFVVRKCAHAGSYFLLTILFIQVFTNRKEAKYIYQCSLLCSFLYACSDEFHQLFVEGRAGQFQDVLIDMSGGLLAIGLCFIIQWYRKTRVLRNGV